LREQRSDIVPRGVADTSGSEQRPDVLHVGLDVDDQAVGTRIEDVRAQQRTQSGQLGTHGRGRGGIVVGVDLDGELLAGETGRLVGEDGE